jgi:hypothetical protein
MSYPSYDPTGVGHGPEAKPFYRQPWFVVIGGLVAAGVVGAVVGGASVDGSSSGSVAAPSSSSAARLPTDSSAPSTTPAPTSAPVSTATAGTGVDFTMPDLVGTDLQSAQDLVQTYGVFLSVSHDLLGSRNQLVDSNWIVCEQNIAPGERVTGDVEGEIDFGVVKRGETCP